MHARGPRPYCIHDGRRLHGTGICVTDLLLNDYSAPEKSSRGPASGGSSFSPGRCTNLTLNPRLISISWNQESISTESAYMSWPLLIIERLYWFCSQPIGTPASIQVKRKYGKGGRSKQKRKKKKEKERKKKKRKIVEKRSCGRQGWFSPVIC